VSLGALMHLAGLRFDLMAGVLADTFRHKGPEIIEQNVGVARAGFDFARAHGELLDGQWTFGADRLAFMNGNTALALGAVAAGCKFYAAYPMSPASHILHWLTAHSEKCGVVVKQAEDEIAVANMTIGAGHAGVRAMCATSGGGFSLMTEAIGMAGMIEAPAVFINVQRGGPSTGIPTKTEQGDLNQALGASQGDFPRVIMAPANVVDCYYAAAEAHNLAEQFQLPGRSAGPEPRCRDRPGRAGAGPFDCSAERRVQALRGHLVRCFAPGAARHGRRRLRGGYRRT